MNQKDHHIIYQSISKIYQIIGKIKNNYIEIIDNIHFKYFHNIRENRIKFQGINSNSYVVFNNNSFTLITKFF